MDPNALQEAIERWVEAGLIDEETARAIEAFEADRTTESSGWLADLPIQSRLVGIISVMGASLIGAGVLWLVALYWDALSTLSRTALLVAAPIAAGIGGWGARRGGAPTVGTAGFFLAVVLVGPVLFLGTDLHGLEIAPEWLLSGWAIVALPVGHALGSAVTVGVGAIIALLAVGASTPEVAPFVLAFLGAAFIGLGAVVTPISDGRSFAGVYRVVGIVAPIGLLLGLGAEGGSYSTFDGATIPLVIAVLAAVAVTVVGARQWQRGGLDLSVPVGVATATFAVGGGYLLVIGTPPVPTLVSYLLVHMLLLGLLVAVVWLGVRTQARGLVNIAAIALLVQIGIIIADTIGAAFSGAVALLVAGGLLIVIGVVLERGRRRVLARVGGS